MKDNMQMLNEIERNHMLDESTSLLKDRLKSKTDQLLRTVMASCKCQNLFSKYESKIKFRAFVKLLKVTKNS